MFWYWREIVVWWWGCECGIYDEYNCCNGDEDVVVFGLIVWVFDIVGCEIDVVIVVEKGCFIEREFVGLVWFGYGFWENLFDVWYGDLRYVGWLM